MKPLDIKENDFLGVFNFNYGSLNFTLQFSSDGRMKIIDADGSINSRVYSLSNSSLTFSDALNPNSCDASLTLRQRGLQWNLLTIREASTPIGCSSSPYVEVWAKAKIDTSIDVSYMKGKKLKIPDRGLCGVGIGEALINIELNGIVENQRNVNAISPLCTEGQLISGVMKESGIPGVLVFEFNGNIPRSKFFFSVLEESGRAMTAYSIEKTVPHVEFDFVYGAETTFTLE
jgi:hypothetical protein